MRIALWIGSEPIISNTMYLTRHLTPHGARLALDGAYLPQFVDLKMLLELPFAAMQELLQKLPGMATPALRAGGAAVDTPSAGEAAVHPLLPPLDPAHEVWAAGVTYRRSREAREQESDVKDVYEKVYTAERPELFFKAIGWRVAGHKMPIRVRHDSGWNVPEPELTLVINGRHEIVGYCAGNDVSSRDIEGANPLYLPQAKIYNGSCAIGPGIEIAAAGQIKDIPIQLDVFQADEVIYHGQTQSSQIQRPLEQLVDYLTREMDFPYGVFLMTGTGIVPADEFSLQPGNVVQISVGPLVLENIVEELY